MTATGGTGRGSQHKDDDRESRYRVLCKARAGEALGMTGGWCWDDKGGVGYGYNTY